MFRTFRAIRFLFLGPILLLIVFVISRMTAGPHTWFKWAALGIAIVWVLSLFRVLWAAFVLGGLAAVIAYISSRRRS